MKFLAWLIFLVIEIILAKITWLLIESLVISGLSPLLGIFLAGLFVLFAILLWRYAARLIGKN